MVPLGALICGALLYTEHTFYSLKMYGLVPEWRPELLKSVKKQRGVIKRFFLYSSISLLLFFAGLGLSLISVFPFCGCSALW